MAQKIISRDDLPHFVNKLIRKYEVIAPVKEVNTKFKQVNSFDEIYLDGITEVPAKEFFIPESETILEFKKGRAKEVSRHIKKRVIFGLRMCDLNAIKILDSVMFDKNYLERRKKTFLVGIFCENPDKYCFCNSMELENYFDLFIFPDGDNYRIAIGSNKGKRLVRGIKTSDKDIEIPKPKNKKVLKNKNIEKKYRNKAFEEDARKCLSCSACTAYCPTCNCFDFKDVSDFEGNSKRIRRLSSCMLKNFSEVAGGKSYRDSRLSRFKHFIFHKLVYFKKQKGRYMCVGCGRCLRVCPTKIDWVNTLNKMGERK